MSDIICIQGLYGGCVYVELHEPIEFEITNMNNRGRYGFGVRIRNKTLHCRTRGEASDFMRALKQQIIEYRR